jgi:hypothetical protein
VDLKEIVWNIMDWIYLTQDRVQWQDLANRLMNSGGYHKRREIY